MRIESPLGAPLTDPRSVGASLLLHAVLLLALWKLASGVVAAVPPEPATLSLQLGPIDNRAQEEQDDDQGGGPGELGGKGPRVAVRIEPGEEPSSDPALEAYLATTTPDPDPAMAVETGKIPPDARGVGTLDGPGLGGGGGTGGGSGGGKGRGTGPGTEFFGLTVPGNSFVFLIDQSGSMSNFQKLDMAKRELLESLDALPPEVEVAVYFYNREIRKLRSQRGDSGLMPATPANKAAIRQQVESIAATGGTDHASALRAGFSSGARVVFFLTDGQLLSATDSERLQEEADDLSVQVVEFGVGPDSGSENPSRRLAEGTGGRYRYFDVRQFEE